MNLAKSLVSMAVVCAALVGCGDPSEPAPAPDKEQPDPRANPQTREPEVPEIPEVPKVSGEEEESAEPGEGARTVEPFNGEDLTGWKFEGRPDRIFWTVGEAKLDPDDPIKLIVEEGGSDLANPLFGADIYTERKFGDVLIELEVMIPEGSNSGIYVMGEYEVQVLDDPTIDPENPGYMDHGAIARAAAPQEFVAAEPGEWQKFVIDFRAPRFNESGEKIANAKFVKVEIDGTTVHENVELEETTLGGLTVEEHATGPLYLQGREGPVAFRNIRITPLE